MITFKVTSMKKQSINLETKLMLLALPLNQLDLSVTKTHVKETNNGFS